MIKSEIRSLIKNLLPRIDRTSKYHENVIDRCVERILSEMYVELWSVNPRLLDAFTRTYSNIAVATDAGTTQDYSVLSVKICHIPDKASGVRHIYTLTQAGNLFHPMDAYEADYLYNSDSAVVTSKIGYKVVEQASTVYPRIDYWNMDAVTRSAGVRMDLLIPFSAYADTDIVLIPEIKDRQGLDFSERVLKLMSVIPPVDLMEQNRETVTKTQ